MEQPPNNNNNNNTELLRQEFAKDKSHHLPNGRFTNPWASFTPLPLMRAIKYFWFETDSKPAKQSLAQGKAPEVVELDKQTIQSPQTPLQMTWLGHASLLVQVEGANILCDPIFSQRCSPFQWLGPKRYTEPPCTASELPSQIDFLIISHNHYDHLDWNTLKQVAARYPDIQVFSALGNQQILESVGFKHVRIADWWDEIGVNGYRFCCTPAQHMTNRGIFDRMAMLWSSWVVIGPSGSKFFFSGDTAYSSVGSNANCPAFKQIGQVYGPIDLAAIAIGAYGPERLLGTVHANPEQAVLIHEDVGARRSVGIHWGTFMLSEEPVDEPPRRLKKEMESRGHSPGDFDVLKIGETIKAI